MKNQNGFTLIEVVAVLIIIVIITIVAIAKSQGSVKLKVETDILKMNIRFAQIMAVGGNSKPESQITITFNADSYQLMRDGSSTGVSFPSARSATHTLPSSVTITSGTGTVTFDEFGSPGVSDYTITLLENGNTKTVTITKNSGYVF